METLEQTEVERLLIYKNDSEIDRLTQEVQVRVDLRNKLHDAGLNDSDLQQVTKSVQAIDEYILRQQLSQNKKLRELRAAGIKAEAELPPDLMSLAYTLKAWHGLKGDKYQNITLNDRWGIDEQAIEKYFIRQQYKIYIQGEQLADYNQILQLCDYLKKHRAEPGQLKTCKFMADRVEHVGNYKYQPRWTYFRDPNR